ncbi:hypothetical protein HQQ94_02925 [Shewanella sp. VB17]|uniref:hypothetical protein n=1 Tax=Shewanella sp. VB17 TaxID=2739432 RepID=UPI001565C32B|nr:hypothetical protein [Shewanella sp. VB17]NRD72206.1 hypothetical protein [Shewanella sp. VB17]
MTDNIINIDELQIKDKWKRRFKLYQQLNADELSRDEMMKSQAFKALSFKERYP